MRDPPRRSECGHATCGELRGLFASLVSAPVRARTSLSTELRLECARRQAAARDDRSTGQRGGSTLSARHRMLVGELLLHLGPAAGSSGGGRCPSPSVHVP